jgi:citrate synthase
MRDDVIFEITKDHLTNGLRKIPLGFCSTSYIDEKKGIYYAGRSIEELIDKDPIEVIHLLFSGWEATDSEIDDFKLQIKERQNIDDEIKRKINNLPKDIDPLELLSMSVLLLKPKSTTNPKEQLLDLLAKMPTLCAYIINHHANIEDNKTENENYLERFANILNLSTLKKDKFLEVLKLYAILSFDHGGGSIDAFVGKTISSANIDLYSCIASSIIAVNSNLIGKASGICFEFLRELSNDENGLISDEEFEKILIKKIEKNEKIYGFGHPIFSIEDPRAKILYNYAQKNFSDDLLIKYAFSLRYVGKKVLSKFGKMKNPYPNIDAIIGSIFNSVGFDKSIYFPIIFAMCRSVGVAIQIYDEKVETFGRKKTKLIHPHFFYRRK